MPIIDIHTHCAPRPTSDRFGVAAAMRGTPAGRNMVTNFRGLPAVAYHEMNDFDLPKICVISGAKDNVVFKDVKFSWVPPWARLFGVLIQALVARRAAGKLPFTEEAHKRYKGAGLWMVLAVFGLLVLWAIGGGISGAAQNPIPFFL